MDHALHYDSAGLVFRVGSPAWRRVGRVLINAQVGPSPMSRVWGRGFFASAGSFGAPLTPAASSLNAAIAASSPWLWTLAYGQHDAAGIRAGF
jgi:hypothetical protein